MMYSWIQLIALFLYHAVNIFTDVKFRKTKNLWHGIFVLVGIVVWYFAEATTIRLITVFGLTMGTGLLLEAIRIGDSRMAGPGDTKMLCVTTLWLGSELKEIPSYKLVLGTFVFYLTILFAVSYITMFIKYGVKETIKVQFYNFRSLLIPGVKMIRLTALERFPGAIAIAIGTFLFYLLVQTRMIQ